MGTESFAGSLQYSTTTMPVPTSKAIIGMVLTAVLVGACSRASNFTKQESSGSARTVDSMNSREATEIDHRIWVVFQSQNGDYWIGSNGNGVYRYDGKRLTNFTDKDGLTGNAVRDIEEDRFGRVFVSTTRGVSQFDGSSFVPLNVELVKEDTDPWRLSEDDVWLVGDPSNNGPYRFDGLKLYQLTLSGSPMEEGFRSRFPNVDYSPSAAYSVYKDQAGHIWFGTASVGLCRFDGKSLSWMYEEQLTTTSEGGAFGIRSIFQDSNGEFWICNTRQRFQIEKGDVDPEGSSKIHYEKRLGFPNAQTVTGQNFTYFMSIAEDGAGGLWIAANDQGVWRFDGDVVEKYQLTKGAFALSIICSQNGMVLVGTANHGLFTLKDGSFKPFNFQNEETSTDRP